MVRKPFERKCITCGKWKHITKFSRAGKTTNGKIRYAHECKSCRSLKRKKMRREVKLEAIAYLGGACAKCGLKSSILDVYDFHHVDPNTKLDVISKMIQDGYSFKELRHELKKCILLCKNCHAILHHIWRNNGNTEGSS